METTTRILLVCANPRGSNPLRTGEEDRTLRESIQLSPHRARIEIQTLNAATVDDLRRALLWSKFDVVHFSGHGTNRGLVFEDAQGALMVPSSFALAKLLAARGVKVSLLNACYSLSVGKITAIGLDYTIASSGPISDPAAIEFARGFYDALGANASVPDAYEEGVLAAELKSLRLDAILLKRGEEYSPPPAVAGRRDLELRTSTEYPRGLLGVAVDVSGSMKQSIANSAVGMESRFDSVKMALSDFARRLGEEGVSDSARLPDTLRVFVVGFGLRIGHGVMDLGSLWKATEKLDLKREIESRRARYESPSTSSTSGYGDLADLARRHGFGGLVDSVTRVATSSIRDKILGEVAQLVVREAVNIGDTTLTLQEVASIFGESSTSPGASMLEQVIFGTTPMAEAAKRVKDRFHTQSDYDQQILLVVSDGKPDADPLPIFQAVRESGVNIVTCFVTDQDVAEARLLVGEPRPLWSEGARLMWEIASPLDESSEAARYLLGHGWLLEPNAKMFVQVNHSDVLKEFVRVAGTSFTSHVGTLLPQGR